MATLLEQVQVDTELRPAIAGRNPWALAARRLWHNRISMAALGLETDLRAVARSGFRVGAAAVASLAVLGALSLALIHGLRV